MDDQWEDSVGALCDSIEVGLRMAAGHVGRGDHDLATEILRSAWQKYVRFADALQAYTRSEQLRESLITALLANGESPLSVHSVPSRDGKPIGLRRPDGGRRRRSPALEVTRG